MQRSSKIEINLALKEYKTPTGQLNYPALFNIPSENRLSKMAEKEPKNTIALLVAALTMAFESLNLVRGMNANQIFDLADAIVETSAEDNLAIEDLMLFLQKLTRGEFGKMYEGMDIPKFMQMFEIYREDRFQAIRNIRDEMNASFSPDRSDVRLSDLSQREESIKNTAALVHYELLKKQNQ